MTPDSTTLPDGNLNRLARLLDRDPWTQSRVNPVQTHLDAAANSRAIMSSDESSNARRAILHLRHD